MYLGADESADLVVRSTVDGAAATVLRAVRSGESCWIETIFGPPPQLFDVGDIGDAPWIDGRRVCAVGRPRYGPAVTTGHGGTRRPWPAGREFQR